MSEEPVYEYVKGSGWVINPPTLVVRQGKTYRVEMRKPNPGELCCWNYASRQTPEDWAEWFKNTVSTYTYENLERDLSKTAIAWVTFVEDCITLVVV